ncbi:uncharacterized protein LOC111263332 isoform X3 [Varroa jacobsoni]|uniref:uncharacterized protein LOC111263332 isoform X3 n=1 Tax=Varroa jacobsoni TaxID=62625 RepID=UPI000BF763E2|nr:uncharacterized protein LOC111263332 isoform X3 [Varroa jacobsoni]
MDGDLITDQPVVHSERPLEPSNSNNGFDDIEEMAWWEALRSGWEQYMLWALCFIIFRITLTFLRLSNTKYKPNMKKPCKAMFVLGSGGHTTEMFHLLTDLNYLLFSPRLYVHGSNDQLSATRAIQFEGSIHSAVASSRRSRGERTRNLYTAYFVVVRFRRVLPKAACDNLRGEFLSGTNAFVDGTIYEAVC